MWKPTLLFVLLLGILGACTETTENPFDNSGPTTPIDTTEVPLDLNSIAGLHAEVIVPTCANSGCHDGTFEPDFRTIESTYNTLVYHPIIKNDPMGTYEYRVVPGDPDASQFMARLTYDIDGNSGVMPLGRRPGCSVEHPFRGVHPALPQLDPGRSQRHLWAILQPARCRPHHGRGHRLGQRHIPGTE